MFGLIVKCEIEGCENIKIQRGKYCVEHRVGKPCQIPDCEKRARGKADYCVEHGGGKPCQIPDCKKSAVGKTDYCKKHGGGKRCQTPYCKKSAQGKTDYCKKHGGGKPCQIPDCKKSAVGKTDYCVEHGGGKRCQTPYCEKSAQGKTDYCVAHGGGKRCPNCIDWIDSRSGSPKYDWYCATCFKRLFPSDPRSMIIYEHTKEIRVRNAINERNEGFIHDRPLYTGHCDCTHRRRIDHRKLIGNTILAVETDEFGHERYDEHDEEIRYDDLYMIHSGKWIFIRFNPDMTKTQKSDLDDRIPILLETIEHQIERIQNNKNTELVEIIRLFY